MLTRSIRSLWVRCGYGMGNGVDLLVNWLMARGVSCSFVRVAVVVVCRTSMGL